MCLEGFCRQRWVSSSYSPSLAPGWVSAVDVSSEEQHSIANKKQEKHFWSVLSISVWELVPNQFLLLHLICV